MSDAEKTASVPTKEILEIAREVAGVSEQTQSDAYQFVAMPDDSKLEVRVTVNGNCAFTEVDVHGDPIGPPHTPAPVPRPVGRNSGATPGAVELHDQLDDLEPAPKKGWFRRFFFGD